MERDGLVSSGISDLKSAHSVDNCFFVESICPAVRGLERIIEEIAPTDIPVMLVGESGTGKEVAALRVHQLSRRRSEPFLKLVCTTLAPDFLEVPLREDGEVDRRNELLRAGTVFLDEISELDAACQPKLLQFLPDGDVLPHEGKLQARVISATRRDLEEEIRAQHFREELYYRLNGVCIHLPPLRHRKEDIPSLTNFLLAKFAAQLGRPVPSLTPQTLRNLMGYSWPGNIRQMENVVKKIVALGDEHRALEDFQSVTPHSPPTGAFPKRISLKQAARAASREAERELILKALERTRWNRKRAAKELQISYKALLYKLKQIGMGDSEDSLSPRREQG
jgi:two-component system response regulator AtoC